ncbi:NADP-dependent oxidoreductase [Sagittula salina]|uniref:NADP-dependent oxidoreductase n=1 Tax=Sagittula salina TaxID=2820268 RepID=A0A940RZT1_9RHOB|nr:NADP-dependent oxidoreductase [Sagittula salina]MBP0481446.1 NADP-dependent oxidoreductase [Sagittula salina]
MPEQMTRITLARRPAGTPVPEDFGHETYPLPEPGDGEVLVKVEHLSLDPYMRGRMNAVRSYSAPLEIGETMTGQGIGRVVASKADDLPVGTLVTGRTGWASHAVLQAAEAQVWDESLPQTAALGVLGMPGFTAWTGLREYGRPRAGETLVIAAATGPVGAMVGQLAKAAGLRTVAVAGGAEKCRIAVDTFGFDAAIDHRAHADASSLRKALAEACPDGIDIYWENVGGKVLEAVMPLMNDHGRIPVCGTIAWYSGTDGDTDRLPMVWRTVLTRRLSVNGFIIFDHWDGYPDFLREVAPKVTAGEITWLEDVTEGLDNAVDAFIALLSGGNTGKAVVKL